MERASKKVYILLIYVALALATFIAFGQLCRSDFVNYDDDVYVTENPHVNCGITADSIFWAFTSPHCNMWHPLTSLSHMLGYARSLLAGAGKDAQLRLVNDLDHREAFRIRTENGKTVIEAAAGAGLIYGAQAIADGDYEPVLVEKPDFDIRGTTLCLMPGGYRATLSPELYPWFYDKEFMTRTLDSFAAARLNTIFLWAGHMFPYIVEMPDYPEASSDVPPEQVKANQKQFRWFTSECEKRNIKVLLHFYNIHVSPPFAKAHKMRTNPTTPTPLLKEYTHYALSRYFKEFASVGLYACPGESIHSKYQLEWFRDVIFDAAKKSGKNPEIVIRDWTINTEFRDSLKSLYDNVYSELKHNDESLTSPYPDLRHMQLEGTAAGHIVNFHLVTDLVPMRWGSPVMLQESMQHLKRLGFVKGVEFFGQMFWKWPYTLDKLEPSQKGYFPKGPKLVSLDRDAIYFKAFGRYLWRSDCDPRKEQEYWTQYLAKKFGSHKVGQLLYQWYVTSGPISPGLQNLNATKVAGWWPSVMLHNQSVDQILTYNKRLDETPYTLYRETGRAGQRFYPRPFDAFFFDRYRKTYGLPKSGSLPSMYKEFSVYKQRLGIDQLEQRHCMPVSQYAKALEEGTPIDQAMTPDKTATLLNTLAKESLELANQAVQSARESNLSDEKIKELERFVTDSKMYVLATEALLHKEQAAILKARMLITLESKLAGQFLKHMEQSIVSYQKLAALTTTSYLHGNDLMKSHWKDSGLKEFQNDLAAQKKWLEGFTPLGFAAPLHTELTRHAANGTYGCRWSFGYGVYNASVNKTVICWNGEKMSIYVREFDHTTQRWSEPVKAYGLNYVNYHNYPCIALAPDGHYLIFYFKHSSAAYMVKSQSPNRITGTWAHRKLSGDKCAYPMPIVVGDTVYLFYSSTVALWHRPYRMTSSTDNGKTWSEPITLIDSDHKQKDKYDEVYAHGFSVEKGKNDKPDRILLGWEMRSGPKGHNKGGYGNFFAYFNCRDQKMYNAGGKDLGDTVDLQEMYSDCIINDAKSPDSRPFGQTTLPEVLPDGSPGVLYTLNDKTYIAQWKEGTWKTTKLEVTGRISDYQRTNQGTYVILSSGNKNITNAAFDLINRAPFSNYAMLSGGNKNITVWESKNGVTGWQKRTVAELPGEMGSDTAAYGFIDGFKPEVQWMAATYDRKNRKNDYSGKWPVYTFGAKRLSTNVEGKLVKSELKLDSRCS